MMNWRLNILLPTLAILMLSSCSDEVSQRLAPTSRALGLANHITVVSDESMWETDIRDTFEYYYQAAYPILPQPEPLFDVRHYNPIELNRDEMKRELRTYIFLADLNDPNSETTKMVLNDLGAQKANKAKTDPTYNSAVGYNRWASDQMVIYLFGKNREDLQKQIVKQFPAVAKKINKFDEEKIYSTTYLAKSSTKLNNQFQETYKASIDIPSDYFLAIHEGKTMWFRKETDFISYNIMVTEFPYVSESQLSKAGQKQVLDSLGLKYVSTELDGTYKKINDTDLPMLAETSNLGNAYAIETRGIWEIENDFMGGPFLSYGVLSPDKKRIILLEGFVHAPGKEKRKHMQFLEVILKSFKFDVTQ